MPIRKLQRKYSLVNMTHEECYVVPIEEKVRYLNCDEKLVLRSFAKRNPGAYPGVGSRKVSYTH